MTNELMQAVQPFCSTVLTDVLPHVSSSATVVQQIPDVAANVAAATPGMPDMPMTKHIIKAVNKQLQLLELVKEQVKFLYLLEGRPPVMSEHEYGIMANFMCDSVPTVRQYRKILFSLLDEGTNSYYYIKAMAEFFWTP